MAKITLNNVTNPQNVTVMNNNFQKISEELNNRVLYRNNPIGEPNQLNNNLDMNGRRVYNLPAPIEDHEPARKKDLVDVMIGGDIFKTVRVTDEQISPVGNKEVRAGKFLSFDGEGNPQTVVNNSSTPAINSRIDAALLVYPTLSEATTNLPNLPDGQLVEISSTGTRYTVSLGSLVFNSFIPVVLEESFTITVGIGGEVTSINQAIEMASRRKPTFKSSNVQCEILLLPGFIAREQIIVKGGQDLGWIKITASDAVVPIDESFVVENIAPLDSAIPFIGAIDNSTAPHLAALFSYTSNDVGKDGIAAIRGSRVSVEAECGVRNCRRGIIIYYASEGWCYMDGLRSGDGSATTKKGADFRNCLGRALDVQYGSRAGFARSNFDDSASAGGPAVYAIWSSSVDIFQSSIKRCGGTGVYSRDGSTINARETDVSDCASNAFHATHQGRINARSKLTGVDQWVGDSAKRCRGSYAILASYCSHIDAAERDVSGCLGIGVHASNGSSICFEGGIASNCGTIGILAFDVSSISALGATVNGNPNANVQADEGSTVCISNGTALGPSAIGVLASDGGRVVANTANISGCARAVEARQGSSITCLNANLNNSSERVISAIGGEVNCVGASFTGAGSFQITVRDGGKVVATNSAMAIDLRLGGGIVHNNGGTGSVSQAVNTITGQGIIFR